MYEPACMSVQNVHRGQKKVSDPMELEFRVVVFGVWVLENEPWSSRRATSAPGC